MEDIFAGDVSQHLMLLVMVTALSSSPFLFHEAWRSSSHVRECAVTHKWEGNHWVQDCWESKDSITERHSGSSGCGDDVSHSQGGDLGQKGCY